MQAPQRPISPLRQAPGLPLSYRVREPAPARPTACVILLHGVGGNESNLAELAAAIDPAALVLLPRGPLQLGLDQYAWFRVMFTSEGPRLDPAEANRARETLLAFIAGIQVAYQLRAEQIVVAGFSQGGIMSASVALSEPERVRGFGILSGRILPELAPYLASRERLGALQAFISHGEQDDVLPVSWAQRAEQSLSELGVHYESRRYAARHVLTPAMQRDFLVWCNALLGLHSNRQESGEGANEGVPTSARRRTMQLEMGGALLRVSISDEEQVTAVRTIDIGVESIAQTWFRHEPPSALELERAIEVIENNLEALREFSTTELRLFTRDRDVLEIAKQSAASFQPGSALGRDAVEETFGRLAAVAQGLPASVASIPADRSFAARLLILREFMHHMKFDSIDIE